MMHFFNLNYQGFSLFKLFYCNVLQNIQLKCIPTDFFYESLFTNYILNILWFIYNSFDVQSVAIKTFAKKRNTCGTDECRQLQCARTILLICLMKTDPLGLIYL